MCLPVGEERAPEVVLHRTLGPHTCSVHHNSQWDAMQCTVRRFIKSPIHQTASSGQARVETFKAFVKRIVYLKSTSNFGPLRSISFFLRKHFLMWVSGWVGGSGGGAQAATPPHGPLGNGKPGPGAHRFSRGGANMQSRAKRNAWRGRGDEDRWATKESRRMWG